MNSNQAEITINTHTISSVKCYHQFSDELDDAQLNGIVGGETPVAASRFGISIDGVQIGSISKAHYCGENLYISSTGSISW